MRNFEPLPGKLRDLDLAAELVHVPAHHIHADAAAGNVGGFFRRREAGQEDQVVDLLVGEDVVLADEVARLRLGEDAFLVEAGAVVAHFDGDVAAAVIGVEVHRADGRLALGDAHVGHFDAVVDAVADQMDQRVADLFHHGLVELGLLAGELEVDLLAEPLREVTRHAREAAEHETDGQHAHAHDAFLQAAHVALEVREARTELLGIRAFELLPELAQHGLRDDELADGVHELVDLLDADADGTRAADGGGRRFPIWPERTSRDGRPVPPHRRRRRDAGAGRTAPGTAKPAERALRRRSALPFSRPRSSRSAQHSSRRRQPPLSTQADSAAQSKGHNPPPPNQTLREWPARSPALWSSIAPGQITKPAHPAHRATAAQSSTTRVVSVPSARELAKHAQRIIPAREQLLAGLERNFPPRRFTAAGGQPRRSRGDAAVVESAASGATATGAAEG